MRLAIIYKIVRGMVTALLHPDQEQMENTTSFVDKYTTAS